MSYQPRPLASGDDLLNSRDQIRKNFEIIRDIFAENHIGYDETGEGKHKFLQMPDQGSAPTTAANELGVYAKDVSGVSNLYLRSENDGEEYRMTTPNDANIATFGATPNGWTFLPGGLIMQYGLVSITSDITVVTYPFQFPNGVINVQATARSNTTLYVHINQSPGPTATNFRLQRSATITFNSYWTAIGY